LGHPFHHKIRNHQRRLAFKWRAIVTIKDLAPFVNSSDAYRARAEACLKLAEVFNDPHAKMVLANMAEGWLRLADYVEYRRQIEAGDHFGTDSSHDQDANPE
jgi:hypothetical protein